MNGLPPYTWSTFGPVGDGFTFNPATGTITNPGPPVAGTGEVDIEVTDAATGDSALAVLSLTVDP